MLHILPKFDKVIIIEGEPIEVSFTILNDGSQEVSGKPYIILRVLGKEEAYLLFDNIKLAPGESKEFEAKVKPSSATGEGLLGIYFEVDGKNVASSEYPIYVTRKGEPIYVAFVWHHHQAPQYYPDGTFKDLWAYKHVFEGEFYGFSRGPYSVHMEVHGKHPLFHDVDHFSPSLLEQWEYLIKGDALAPKDLLSKKSELEELLLQIRQLIKDGVIEPLGSVYAHTILGFILRKANEKGLSEEATTLIKWEIMQGLKIVERVLGKRPAGFWTPEMFWSMELVNIYHEMGISYTVLCEQHFAKSGGDKQSVYEPYLVQDPVTANELVVFFRDLHLSNWISFNVDFKDEKEADLSARKFVVELAKRRESFPGGIVVIALDGENWMIMPSYRRYAPLFFERIINYIDNSEVIITTTLEKYLQTHKPSRVLTYIPYGSWINLSAHQWTGSVKDQLWEKAFTALTKVMSLYFSLGEEAWNISQDEDSGLFKALKSLAIAMDSDFYWYGEIEKERNFIETWTNHAIEIVESFIKNNLKISVVEKGKSHIILQLENHSSLPLQITLNVKAKNYTNETKITLRPKTLKRIPVYTPEGDNTQVHIKLGKSLELPLTASVST